jgi:hypothetical protein
MTDATSLPLAFLAVARKKVTADFDGGHEEQESLASVRKAANPRVNRVMTHLNGLIGNSGHV